MRIHLRLIIFVVILVVVFMASVIDVSAFACRPNADSCW